MDYSKEPKVHRSMTMVLTCGYQGSEICCMALEADPSPRGTTRTASSREKAATVSPTPEGRHFFPYVSVCGGQVHGFKAARTAYGCGGETPLDPEFSGPSIR